MISERTFSAIATLPPAAQSATTTTHLPVAIVTPTTHPAMVLLLHLFFD